MARVEVVMPKMGESIVEGTIVEWLKKVGDTVEAEEDLFTLSTDKVDTEVSCPAAGVLVELLAAVGETVEVDSVVAIIETDAAAARAEPAPAKADSKAAEPAVEAPSPSEATTEAPTVPPEAVESEPAEPAESEPEADPPTGPEASETPRPRVTPVVRRIASEHGIEDLSAITGTGVSGRVTRRDIEAFIAKGDAAPDATATAASAAPPPPPPPPQRGKVPPPPPIPTPGDAKPATAAPPGYEIAFVKPARVHIFENDRVEPMSRMRASMAENMLQARRGTAHCHTVWEADVTPIVRARKRLAPEFAERGVKLTYTAFFVSAVIDGLRAFPLMNAAIDGGNIVYRGDINVGVAAAVDEGLIVPVLKHADTLNLFGIARGVNDLGERSRNRKLMPQDVSDGTFTVSNAGIWGSLFGVPVLVPPQVGILGIGGIKKRVVADDDENIRVRSMVYMCLTFDHRLIDGATADGFMRHVSGQLSDWKD